MTKKKITHHLDIECERIASELNDKSDDELFDIFMCFAQLQGIDYLDVNGLSKWIKESLTEIRENLIGVNGGQQAFLDNTKLI